MKKGQYKFFAYFCDDQHCIFGLENMKYNDMMVHRWWSASQRAVVMHFDDSSHLQRPTFYFEPSVNISENPSKPTFKTQIC